VSHTKVGNSWLSWHWVGWTGLPLVGRLEPRSEDLPAGALLTTRKYQSVESYGYSAEHRDCDISCTSGVQLWACHSITAEAVAKAPSTLTRLLRPLFLINTHVVACAAEANNAPKCTASQSVPIEQKEKGRRIGGLKVGGF